MTTIKATIENLTILDFSNGKFSKHKIKQTLRQCEMRHCRQGKSFKEVVIYRNYIQVGMYSILIYLPHDSSSNCNRLNRYGDFEVRIFDSLNKGAIKLSQDSRFKEQSWVIKNTFGKLHISHLIEIILYCKRLDNLKCFI